MTKVWKEKKILEWNVKNTEGAENWIKEIIKDRDFNAGQFIFRIEEEDGQGLWYWHIHHEILVEKAIEPIQKRIDYVKNTKDHVETRLKLMTSVKDTKFMEAYEQIFSRIGGSQQFISPGLIILHRKEHPDCPWNGKSILEESK
jgi:hypothetical protein